MLIGLTIRILSILYNQYYLSEVLTYSFPTILLRNYDGRTTTKQVYLMITNPFVLQPYYSPPPILLQYSNNTAILLYYKLGGAVWYGWKEAKANVWISSNHRHIQTNKDTNTDSHYYKTTILLY
jgi:hypothetical protein